MVEHCTASNIILSSEPPKSLIKLLTLMKGLRKYVFMELDEEFCSVDRSTGECLFQGTGTGFGSS